MWKVILGERYGGSQMGREECPQKGVLSSWPLWEVGLSSPGSTRAVFSRPDRTATHWLHPLGGGEAGGWPQGHELPPPIAGLGAPPPELPRYLQCGRALGQELQRLRQAGGVVSSAVVAGSRMAQGMWDRHQKPPPPIGPLKGTGFSSTWCSRQVLGKCGMTRTPGSREPK